MAPSYGAPPCRIFWVRVRVSAAIGGVTNADSTRVFSTPGTYMYHCSIHTYMMGTVVVQ